MPGTLFVVATPIGNLEDISMRALRVLREAAVIAAEDTRRTQHLLARYGIPTPTTSLHEHNEVSKVPTLLARLERGDSVALVSDAGTPSIADPGRHLVEGALTAGIRVEPIPGPNAAVATLAASGLSGDSYVFLGFPPTRSKDREAWLHRLEALDDVAVFYEAPHRLRATLQDILERFGDIPLLIGRELTKKHEELVKLPISRLLTHFGNPLGEFTIVGYFGKTTKSTTAASAEPQAIVAEFGRLAINSTLNRRAIISRLATKYGVPQNQLYRMIEDAKK